MKKRSMAIILCFLMLFTSVLYACGKKETDSTGTPDTTAKKDEPKQEEIVEISVFGPDLGVYYDGTSLKDGKSIYEEFAKRTNTKFKWNLDSTLYVDTSKITAYLASGQNLDDILGIGYENPIPYIESGLFLPLDDLIEQYGPNIKKWFQENPMAGVWNVYPEDGKIYSVTQSSFIGNEWSGGWVFVGREDWLDRLGLDVPETLDEFYDACVAIKNNDPNGNNVQDEVAISFALSYVVNVTGTAFGLHGLYNGWIYPDKNDTMRIEMITDEYKEMLVYLNKLYKAGVIDPDLFTGLDYIDFKKKLDSNTVGFYPCNLAAAMGGVGSELYKTYKDAIPSITILKGPDGKQMVESASSEWKRYVISKDCKNPVHAMKVLDYCFTKEGRDLMLYGIEGVHYEIEDGEPVKKAPYDDPEYLGNKDLGLAFDVLPSLLSPMLKKTTWDLYHPNAYEGQLKIQKFFDPCYYVPHLPKSKAEQEALSTCSDWYGYAYAEQTKFITGEVPFDQWDNYIKQCKDMGVEDAQKVYQQIYESRYK